ncbi:hypothetical protein HY633_03080 [Candidatus Uhrbacteria bacterium]|nr:hypothetical protein [Candidatus Uhrbacteria bacterium]
MTASPPPVAAKLKFLAKVRSDHVILFLLNVAIIASAQVLGDGRLLYDTGAIRFIAVLFVVLAAIRMFDNFFFSDPILRKIIRSALATTILFASTHTLFYAAGFALDLTRATLTLSMVNYYFAGLLILALGPAIALRGYFKSSELVNYVSMIFVAVLPVLTAILSERNQSLRPTSFIFYLYLGVTLIVGPFTLSRILWVKRSFSPLKAFMTWIAWAVVFITTAASINVLNVVMETNIGIPAFQVEYLHLYAFFIAVSIMFLAFDEIKGIGGVYGDIRKEMNEA